MLAFPSLFASYTFFNIYINTSVSKLHAFTGFSIRMKKKPKNYYRQYVLKPLISLVQRLGYKKYGKVLREFPKE